MTHEILQTDIEFAKGLIGTNRPDDEVAVALTRRGIEPAAAAQLVDDLRNGRRVQPQMAAPEWISRRRSASRADTGAEQSPPPPLASPVRASSQKRSGQRRPSRAARKKAKENAIVWVAAGILSCVVVAGALVIKHRHNANRDTEPPKPASTPTPTTSNKDQAQSASPMVLEVRTNGLYLGESLLTREAAWNSVARLLGSPTRTNQIEGSNRLIYAFDHHGILVYMEPGAGTDSIVLDFEGVGGTNGSAAPFKGSLRIEDCAIKAETDSKTLIALKQLGLKDPKADAGIFGSQYHGLELIFAYLKTPEKLSLVEISLK